VCSSSIAILILPCLFYPGPCQAAHDLLSFLLFFFLFFSRLFQVRFTIVQENVFPVELRWSGFISLHHTTHSCVVPASSSNTNNINQFSSTVKKIHPQNVWPWVSLATDYHPLEKAKPGFRTPREMRNFTYVTLVACRRQYLWAVLRRWCVAGKIFFVKQMHRRPDFLAKYLLFHIDAVCNWVFTHYGSESYWFN